MTHTLVDENEWNLIGEIGEIGEKAYKSKIYKPNKWQSTAVQIIVTTLCVRKSSFTCRLQFHINIFDIPCTAQADLVIHLLWFTSKVHLLPSWSLSNWISPDFYESAKWISMRVQSGFLWESKVDFYESAKWISMRVQSGFLWASKVKRQPPLNSFRSPWSRYLPNRWKRWNWDKRGSTTHCIDCIALIETWSLIVKKPP